MASSKYPAASSSKAAPIAESAMSSREGQSPLPADFQSLIAMAPWRTKIMSTAAIKPAEPMLAAASRNHKPSSKAAPLVGPKAGVGSTGAGGNAAFGRASAKSDPVPAVIEEWSPSLKRFVERAFLKCADAEEKDEMEAILKLRIKDAISSGGMHQANWEHEQVPLLKRERLASQKHPGKSLSEEQVKLERRAKRFEEDRQMFQERQRRNQEALLTAMANAPSASDVADWDEYMIIGTSQALEKPYLRLTAAPDPATVRPLPVLKRTLAMLKEKWRLTGDYNYVCDQFKSLRQDLTVQRIKNDFTVQVYEIHARIAIEQGDLGQYNQCQTQLKQLYAMELPGHELEFVAYRILYLLSCNNKQAVNQLLSELSDVQRRCAAVAHALQVLSALTLGNYAQFFRLYRTAPNMSGYLMDLFVEGQRRSALNAIFRAYRPSVSLKFLSETLAFDDVKECSLFLSELSVVFDPDSLVIDCKSSALLV